MLDGSDLYRSVFMISHGVVGAWAARSKALLIEWGVADWTDWAGPLSTRGQYKSYVTSIVRQRCHEEWVQAERNTRGLSICRTESAQVSNDLVAAPALGMPWHSLILQRSLCRLRANLLCFSHLDGRRSQARRQRCILCSEPVLSPTFHVLCRCTHQADLRDLFWSISGTARPESITGQVGIMLACAPGDPGYEALLALAGCLDRDARHFWGGDV